MLCHTPSTQQKANAIHTPYRKRCETTIADYRLSNSIKRFMIDSVLPRAMSTTATAGGRAIRL